MHHGQPAAVRIDRQHHQAAADHYGEASVGNASEQGAVAWTVLNRLLRNRAQSVASVQSAYACSRAATIPIAICNIATTVLNGSRADPTGGATHFYSPISMPHKGQSTAASDVGGCLTTTPGIVGQHYQPSWVVTYQEVTVPGVRPAYFRFCRVPGSGPVS